MITLLTGENSFEIKQALDEIVSKFDGEVERFDGEELKVNQLPDLLMGETLFSTARTIVIRELGGNKAVWTVLPAWLERMSDDIHLVLVEAKPDKRTSTYKALKDAATVRDFPAWTSRDVFKAEAWVVKEAEKQNFKLDKKLAHQLVEAVGVDQWQLFHAVEKLALVDEVNAEVMNEVINRNPSGNAFDLLALAIRGDLSKLQTELSNLKLTEDPYQLFGLLSGQVFQLAAIANAGAGSNVAKDFGIHPFVVTKMTPIAKKIGPQGVKKLVEIFTAADLSLKTSATEPWVIIENVLVKLSILDEFCAE